MILRTIPSMPAIFFTARTTLKEIDQFTGTVAGQLYKTAARQDILPAGPLQWIYTGADGKPDTIFTLEIALPVTSQPTEETEFLYKELASFECVSVIHHGAWEYLFETYDRVIDDMYTAGKKPSGYCREQYLYMDFNRPANNLTEVLMGIES